MSEKSIPFDGLFPLPFRVFSLIGLGVLGWATNLHALDRLGVDVIAALDMQTADRTSPLSLYLSNPRFKASTIYFSVYRFFVAFSIWCFGAWVLFTYAVRDNILFVDAFRHVPAICGLFILIALITPADVFQKRVRDVFLFALSRCLFSAPDEPVHFSDVLFADILTSFAKVLGDVWLSLCMLLPGGSLLFFPPQEGWSRWILPTIMSLPYFVRFRQCLIEHTLSADTNRRSLYNAIKYATSFPVIYLSAAQRVVPLDFAGRTGGKMNQESWSILFQLWLLAAAVNSLYSYWWDVTNDWGLDLLAPGEKRGKPLPPPRRLILPSLHSKSPSPTSSPRRSDSFSKQNPLDERALLMNDSPGSRPSYPYGLRSILLYPLPVYPLLIFLNLILRMTWSIKLSSHLHSHSDGSAAIFWLEMAELIRRWMWVFIRVEWEVVRKFQYGELRSPKDRSGSSEAFELLSSVDGEQDPDAIKIDVIDVDQPIS